MDLSSFNTRNAAEQGAELHLKHPALGHRLYTGEGAGEHGKLVDKEKAQPVTLTVFGTESDTVRERARDLQRAKVKGDTAEDDPNADHEAGLAFVCSLVKDWSGITDNGKPLKCTEANKRKFFEQSDDLVDQVLKFATVRANFFGKTASG